MIFIRGARQLMTLRGPAHPRRGIELTDLGVIHDGALLIDGEEIREVGTTRRIENLAVTRSATVIDAAGKVVLPGFVDLHTSLILASLPSWPPEGGLAGEAVAESLPALPMMPRSGSPRIVRSRARAWTRWFAAHGTTTLEVRSGLGLELQSEITGLRAARLLDGDPLDVSRAFVAGGPGRGAAALGDADVEQVTEVLLPIIRKRRLAAICDVRCGPEAFDAGQAGRILERAGALHFGLRVHGDCRKPFNAAGLAVAARALSADGLRQIGDEEIGLLAGSPTIATLLPGVGSAEGGCYAPARQLIDRGAAVALATGFGPASPTLSMPMALSLACREMKLAPEEAIAAATFNAAAALRRAARLGSLEPGKQADLAIFDVRDYREIPYYFGFNLCVMTMKKGRIIHPAPGPEDSNA